MEIGAIPSKPTWKHRIIIAIIFGITFSGTSFLLQNLFAEEKYSNPFLTIQGISFGIIMGLIFPYLNNKIAKQIALNIEPKLSEAEIVENEGPGNMFKGNIPIGGKIFLTNKKIIWKALKGNFISGQTEIDYDNIEEIFKRKTVKLFNNGFGIKTKDGKEYDFVVNEREIWIEKLNEKAKNQD